MIDTRDPAGPFGGPILNAGVTRSIAVASSACGIPASARAFSLNVTVVPDGPLGYLTIWPSASVRPAVSTLNSPAGSIVANAAIVPADANGCISIFVTDRTHIFVDINGYFVGAP